MRLLDGLRTIIQQIESELGVELTDDDFADGKEEIEHIFLHEACHAAISACAPWIHDLDEQEHTTLDEILARLLEVEIGPCLGMHMHSSEEQARELGMYGIEVTAVQYERLRSIWLEQYWPERDVAGMAVAALGLLRSEGSRTPESEVPPNHCWTA